MATTAAATDRLSALPDDLPIRILSFAPAREAASTTALSRRWRRPLWLDTGAVNVDYRSYTTGGGGGDPLRCRALDDIINARLGFLRSRGRGPNKITVVTRADTTRDDDTLLAACSAEEKDVEEEDITAGVVPEPEEYFADAEEFRLEWLDYGSCTLACCTGSLPFAALRVLELTGYSLQPCPDLAFPCLEAMRLRRCRTDYATLQDMISAAPKLADVRLEDVRFVNSQLEYQIRIRCPAATVILMANCDFGYLNFDACRVELDAPRLRRFCYTVVTFRGSSFSFDSPMTHLEERLEIEELCGWCIQNHGVAAVRAVVSLLRCCTVVRELRFKFRWLEYLEEMAEPDLTAAMSDFSLCRSINASHDDDDDDEGCCYDLGLHGLCCGCTLSCLRDSLRRVVVKFDAEELTCFQVRLVKFLAENAMVLEEFVVDGGKGYDSSRIRRKVARWQKRRPSSSPLPPKTPIPQLSEFPPLGSALDPDPIPANTAAMASSIVQQDAI
uniref:F-box domain-containing protein n=1 Tax=Aegilops tauschii TaxID=37682 RepID=M8BEK4_AEGTA